MRRRDLLLAAAGLVIARGAAEAAITDIAIPNPKWPDATDTGYAAAPGWPGRLLLHDGTPLVAGREYRFVDFRGATVTVPGVKFLGCRFSSNWVDGWNVRLANTGMTEFRFCTIEPSRVTAPPHPAWPSAGAGEALYGGAVSAAMIPQALSYQYGIMQVSGGMLVEDCDIWGFANAIVLFGGGQKTLRRCWIHDAAHEGAGASMSHQDGIGHLDGYGCSNVLIEDCVVASLGNTNAIAFQGGRYSNIVLRRNFLSGFGYCVNLSMTGASTGLIFENNRIATDIGWFWGPLYSNVSANFGKAGSSWKGNRLRVARGTVPRAGSNGKFTPDDHYKFLHPTGAYGNEDWTP